MATRQDSVAKSDCRVVPLTNLPRSPLPLVEAPTHHCVGWWKCVLSGFWLKSMELCARIVDADGLEVEGRRWIEFGVGRGRSVLKG
jgi:hypothetical protein